MHATGRVDTCFSVIASGHNMLRTSVEAMSSNDAFCRMLIKLIPHLLSEIEILCFQNSSLSRKAIKTWRDSRCHTNCKTFFFSKNANDKSARYGHYI